MKMRRKNDNVWGLSGSKERKLSVTLCLSISLCLSLKLCLCPLLKQKKKMNKAILKENIFCCVFYEYYRLHVPLTFFFVTHMHSYRSRQRSRQNTKWAFFSNKTKTRKRRKSKFKHNFRSSLKMVAISCLCFYSIGKSIA